MLPKYIYIYLNNAISVSLQSESNFNHQFIVISCYCLFFITVIEFCSLFLVIFSLVLWYHAMFLPSIIRLILSKEKKDVDVFYNVIEEFFTQYYEFNWRHIVNYAQNNLDLLFHYEEQTADTFKWPWKFLIQPFLRWMRGFLIFEVALMIFVGHAQKT